MYNQPNEEIIAKAREELLQYHCADLDFSSIDQNQALIAQVKNKPQELVNYEKKQNREFVQQSEAIENHDVGNDASMVVDNLEITKMPKSWIKKISGCDNCPKNISKDDMRKVLANTNGHFAALAGLYAEAKEAKELAETTGETIELSHLRIMDTNEKLFIKQFDGYAPIGIGSYRSPYSMGNTIVRGASWTPTNKNYVSDYMDVLLDWYNNEANDLHPIVRAAIFHVMFIRIHPFADGNGRTMRLLVNYDFIKHGYQTITINASDKQRYIAALETAISTKDVSGVAELFKELMEKNQTQILEILKRSDKGGDDPKSK